MISASSQLAADSGSVRFKRLRLGLVVLGVLVILAFAGSSAYDAWSSYRHTLAATNREIGNIANALAEQTAWTLEAVDLLLLDTARWYGSDSQKIPSERLDAALAIRTAEVPQVRLVAIVDSQGNQLYRSGGFAAPNQNVSDRSYFIAQRDGTANGLFMSEPLMTRSGGHAGVILSRRLDDDNGHFAGVVTAMVDLEDVNQFYRAVDVGPGGAVQLVRDDGTLLVRNPAAPGAVGKSFPALAGNTTAPAARLVDPIDGHEDLIAVAPVRNTLLKLAVTRESTVALQTWRDETIRVGVRTLVLTLLGALTIMALLRQLRRVAASERALRESKEQLEAQLRQSQKMGAIGTMAGEIAHEFNNILGAILGYGELALQQCAAGTELRRYLDNVMHAAERAKLLVERILGFSRGGPGDRVPENLGGAIDVTSETAVSSLETSRALPRGNGETVMIVDDEHPLVALAEEIIAQLGYEPVGFGSSCAALEAFRTTPERFDVVLTDESMPELIGTELAQAIRQIHCTIPIILMTGYGGAQVANRAADIGVNEVLHKPLRRRDLAESLARILKSVH